MTRSFIIPIAFLATIIGTLASSARAGTLSLRFAGGATEISLGLNQTATIEVLFHFGSMDKAAHRVTGLDARFDVGGLAGSWRDPYVADGSTDLSLTGLIPGDFANWNTAASTSMPAPFNGSFFASVGDPAGAAGPAGNGTVQAPIVIASITVQRQSLILDDIYVVFRVLDPLPAVYNGPAEWVNRFGLAIPVWGQQFEIGVGNPGDARSPYSGFETLRPLVIHSAPEPGTLALLALTSLAAIRRHRR